MSRDWKKQLSTVEWLGDGQTCVNYGMPNSQKWAKHGFTVDKLVVSTVNYSLLTAKYS